MKELRAESEKASFKEDAEKYIEELARSFNREVYENIERLCREILNKWKNKKNIYICGNGGSAANAVHIANDLSYGVGNYNKKEEHYAIKIEALTANTSIVTCLGNDTGYKNIFSHQIKTKGEEDDR